MSDPRLGKRDAQGFVVEEPEVTISGSPLPNKPYNTIVLGGGCFAVLDMQFPPDESVVMELRALASPRSVSGQKRRHSAPEEDNGEDE